MTYSENFCCLACKNLNGSIFFDPLVKVSVSSDLQIIDDAEVLYRCLQCGLIQKSVTDRYNERLSTIYQKYNSQKLLAGEDELNRSTSMLSTRSESIIKNLQEQLHGLHSLLDVGTGSGVFLSAAKDNGFDSFSYDINDNHLNQLLKIVPKNRVFFGDLATVNKKFDIVSAIHVLEHVVDLDDFIRKIKKVIKPHGVFVVQVPLSSANTIDFLIYDHVLHFTPSSIQSLLVRYFKYVRFSRSQIFKEITVVASDKPIYGEELYPDDNAENIDIQHLIDMTHRALSINKPTHVFGSGPASIYIGDLLGKHIISFLDEDDRKIGKSINSIPILTSLNASEMPVFIPFSKEQSQKIAKRLCFKNIVFPYFDPVTTRRFRSF